ncbi:transcription factor HES-5-like [Alosa alosa]|uniref:transcription factor HES-5-like n=1 Tax=Alosa alosa TaxID=278164 RepID=UPI002015363B|nr:transcription factor HES-5-like [Alosa alosa]
MKGISVKRMGSAKASRKLLKPEVEKFRRGRINSSLERLRMMLLHWPDHQGLASKRVEKAEILEHTVTFMKRHGGKQGGGKEHHFRDGYAACLQKAADFLRDNGSNGDQKGDEAQRRAFAVQLTHLDTCTFTATSVPTLHLTRCGAPPDLTQHQWPGLLALNGQRHSSLPKLCPRVHSAKILSPPLINTHALWRPWP